MRCSLFTFLCVLLAMPANVGSMTDGDTITALHDDQQKKVKLHGIDCLEKGQDQSHKSYMFADRFFGRFARALFC